MLHQKKVKYFRILHKKKQPSTTFSDILTKKILLDKVLVVEDVMEADIVDKEVLNAVLVEEDNKQKAAAAPIGHGVFIGGIF